MRYINQFFKLIPSKEHIIIFNIFFQKHEIKIYNYISNLCMSKSEIPDETKKYPYGFKHQDFDNSLLHQTVNAQENIPHEQSDVDVVEPNEPKINTHITSRSLILINLPYHR